MRCREKNKPTDETYAGFTRRQIQKLTERGRKLKEIEILPPDQEMRRVTNEFLKRRVFMKRERKEKIMTALQDKDFAELPIKLLKRLKEHTGPETQKQITEIIEQKRKIRKIKIIEMWTEGMIGAVIGMLIGMITGAVIGMRIGIGIGGMIGAVIGMSTGIIKYYKIFEMEE